MEKEPKQNSYIIKEAESIIDSYLKNREEKEEGYYREKYFRLKNLSIAMGIVFSIGILISIILK